MTAADWFVVCFAMVVFFGIIGLVVLMVHLRYHGPWWCRVLFWLPVLVINIVCLVANLHTLSKAFERSNSR